MNKIVELLNATKGRWGDWKWQMSQKSICSNPDNLKEMGLLTDTDKIGPISLTPYNVKLLMELKEKNPEGYRAEWLQSFPRPAKKKKHQWVWARRHDLVNLKLAKLLPKFLQTLFWGKGTETEVKGLENIYPKTDVILASVKCARNCAQCFRSVGNAEGEASCIGGNMEKIGIAVQKIIDRRTPHVLITGGDPLTRSNEQLQRIVGSLVNSETVQVIRIGTRMPVDLPMRFFDEEFLALFREWARQMRQKGGRILVDVQINHPAELTKEAIQAIHNIQDCGLQVIAQTAVFKGINDNIETLRALFMELDGLGVQPYKVFHSMPVPGTKHLRVPLRRFRKLLAGLHQCIPGTSVPAANIVSLVGKIPIRPAGRFAIGVPFTNRILVRGFRGELYLYKDAMDWLRWLRDGIILATAAAMVLITVGILPHNPCDSPSQTQTIRQIVRLVDMIGYPDGWARLPFKPFVQGDILYIPANIDLERR